jgi:hypothetical protein
MNILYFEPNYVPNANQSYTYYSSLLNSIAKKSNVSIINARGFDVHVNDLIDKAPNKPDLICFGFGWMNLWKGAVKYRETNIRGLEDSKVPTSIILNKEYAGSLPTKLGWIKEKKIDVAFTYHHDYEMFSKTTGVPFHHLPFAADPDMFKDHNVACHHDIGFTGGLGHTFTNGWEKTSQFNKLPDTPPEGQGWSHTLRKQIKDNYQQWDDINFYFSNHHHDNIKDYAERLNTAKMWLSTTGPVDIVGTRYFEVPMTNTTMLVCNRSNKMWCFDENCNRQDKNVNVYENLFEEDKHYVAFDSPEELIEKIRYYKNNEEERKKIVNAAYEHAIVNHTWDARADKFINAVNAL